MSLVSLPSTDSLQFAGQTRTWFGRKRVDVLSAVITEQVATVRVALTGRARPASVDALRAALVRLDEARLPQPEPAVGIDLSALEAAPPPTHSPSVDVPTLAVIQLVFDSGQIESVDRVLVVGRDPSTDRWPGARAVRIVDDAGHTVSKTHFAAGTDVNGLWIEDLRSTNGTCVRADNGTDEKLSPFVRRSVPAGAVITFGMRAVAVRATTAVAGSTPPFG